MFFSTLNVVIKSPIISALAKNLPKSVKRCRKILQISDKVFEKYVSCVRCHSIYEFEECIDKGLRGKRASKHCQYKAYPNHPQAVHRKPCGALLLKEVKCRNKMFCYPFRTFCWTGIIDSLQMLLSRPSFLQKCEHWRLIEPQAGLLRDVYDGKVWSDFQD